MNAIEQGNSLQAKLPVTVRRQAQSSPPQGSGKGGTLIGSGAALRDQGSARVARGATAPTALLTREAMYQLPVGPHVQVVPSSSVSVSPGR